MMSRICFVELPASNLASTRSFYTDAFGLERDEFRFEHSLS